MSQVAVLPHQTNGSNPDPPSATAQPDIGQLSLHHHNHHHYHPGVQAATARRKSSFSSSSSSSNHSNSYRTMPLSRTRSLLANINGVANGRENGTVTNGTGSSTANTPGSEANGYALPSINGSSDHLPPLKGGNPVTASGASTVNGSVNNNKFFNGTNGVVNGSSLTNGYLHHDMDVISTTGSTSLQSTTTSLTNGHLSHINGMQTLPHVRSSGSNEASGASRQILAYGSEEIPDKDLFDNDKSQAGNGQQSTVSAGQNVQSSSVQQQAQIQVVPGSSGASNSQVAPQGPSNSGSNSGSNRTTGNNGTQEPNPQNSVQQSPTNSSALSNNAVNSANNTGSLKPKTMVATPEQVGIASAKREL